MSGWSDWHPSPVVREFRALEAMKVQTRINLTDAEHECAHGKLPLDRVQTCPCWPAEAREALAQRVQESSDFSDWAA